MSRYNYFLDTVGLNRQGDTYWFIGQLGGGGVFDGAGFFVARPPGRATWDQAGWAWLFVTANNASQSMVVDTFPVFFGFNNAKLFDERFRTSFGFMRFVPVPWLGRYDLYGVRMERVP